MALFFGLLLPDFAALLPRKWMKMLTFATPLKKTGELHYVF